MKTRLMLPRRLALNKEQIDQKFMAGSSTGQVRSACAGLSGTALAFLIHVADGGDVLRCKR